MSVDPMTRARARLAIHEAARRYLFDPRQSVNLIDLARPLQKNYEELDSFVIYVCIEGSMTLTFGDQAGVPLKKGEVVLLPASLDVIRLFPQGSTRLLEVYV